MRGHFNVAVKDAGGLRDEDFLLAKSEGRLNSVLEKLAVVQRAEANNQITHWLSAVMISRVVGHSFPNAPFPVYSGNVWPWSSITLQTTDAEVDYTYSWTSYCDYYGTPDSVGSTAAKGFLTSVVESTIFAKTLGGKEEIYFKSRWLYLPSQGNSNNIRSVGVYGCEYTTQQFVADDRYITARVRLKDPDTGLPVILIKNFNQVLVIEYTIFFVSL